MRKTAKNTTYGEYRELCPYSAVGSWTAYCNNKHYQSTDDYIDKFGRKHIDAGLCRCK